MQLILVTNIDLDEKWRWKIHLYAPFLMASQSRWKCNCFCDLEGDS
jgi:hypothetical protein